MSIVGMDINEVENQVWEKVSCKYAVFLFAGITFLHLAMKLADEKV